MNIFSLTQKEEIGGFKSLEIILLADIINCPLFLTNSNAVNFEYNNNRDIDIEIKPVGETINVKASPRVLKSGILYTVKSEFEILFSQKEIDYILNSYQYKKVIIKANQYNGNSIIYGSEISPLTFLYELSHSKKYESISKFEVSITGKIPQKPVIYRAV